MIIRHNGSVGATIFRMGLLNVELWICPSSRPIEKHRHAQHSGRVMFFMARHIFCLLNMTTGATQKTRKLFKWRTIPVGWTHWAECANIGWLPSVFVVVQKWDRQPTSAGIDYVPV